MMRAEHRGLQTAHIPHTSGQTSDGWRVAGIPHQRGTSCTSTCLPTGGLRLLLLCCTMQWQSKGGSKAGGTIVRRR